MGDDKLSQREAKRIKYEEACQILLEKNVLEMIDVKAENNKINCIDNTFNNLKKLAQKHNVSYVGNKKDICKRLEKIGYVFEDSIQSNKSDKCYKKKKQIVMMSVNGCLK